MDTVFAALSHATRRDIVARLATTELTVSEIADGYDISLNAVSKHLIVLQDAGLLRRRVEWRTHYLSINPEPLRTASDWLDRYRVFWDNHLDALEHFLAKKGAKHGTRNSAHSKNRRQPR